MKNFLIACMNSIKAPLLSFLEKDAIKIAIANLIKSPWMLDFRVWMISFAVDYLEVHLLKPAMDYFFQKVGYEYEILDGQHLLKKIKNSSNAGTWSDSANRV